MKRTFLATLAALVAFTTSAFAVQRKTWTQTAADDFQKGDFTQTVATSDGKIQLSRKVRQLLDPGKEILIVTALAEDTRGTVYAATGPKGLIYRREKGKDKFVPYYSGEEKLINCLFIDAADRLYAGTSGKRGKLLRIAGKDRADVLFTDPAVQHVWAVASDGRGNFYLATGAKGKLFKLTAAGKKQVLFTADEDKNFTALAVTPEGVVYAGTDANGLIFRISATGEIFCLYDAPQAEISVLALDAKGNLLVATGSAGAGGSGSGDGGGHRRGVRFRSGDVINLGESRTESRPADASAETQPASRPSAEKLNGPSRPSGPGSRSNGGRPNGGSRNGGNGSGGNALYRISEEGFVTRLLSVEAPILSLAQQNGRILVGTGEGIVHEVSADGRTTAAIIKLEDAELITSILKTAAGDVLLATSEKGGIFAASAGYAAKGAFVSSVQDAGLVSRFGRIQWQAVTPANATVSLATRTGNVEEPGATWSKWSEQLRNPGKSRVLSPPARFIQYRVSFSSMNAKATGVIAEIQVTYIAENQPPKVKLVTADGENGNGKPDGPKPPGKNGKNTTIKWTAEDPNGDKLVFSLYFREVGEPVWILLEEDYEKNQYGWLTDQVADGRYEFRVVASDAADNVQEKAATAERVSDPILVDNTAPVIKDIIYKWLANGSLRVEATVTDATSAITSARFAVDSRSKWRPAAAIDEIFDFPTEKIYFTITKPAKGPHRIAIRATDEAGNTANVALTVLPLED